MANETGEGKAGVTASVVHANQSHPETIADAGQHSRGAHHDTDLDRGDDRLTADATAWHAATAARKEYAQAQPPSNSHDTSGHIEHNAIGRVDKVVGNVTVMRNGVAVVLHTGDAVFKSDVVQTGGASSVGIFLSDGSTIHLAANTRMALNAYSYDVGSVSNAAAFSLIDGSFGFMAGKLANHGDMKIMTPVATMSVHEGATGWAHELGAGETASISAKLGDIAYSFAVADRGDQSHGLFDLIAGDNVVGSINDPHLISYLDQNGNLISLPLDSSRVTGDLAQWLQAADVVPGALGVHGSGSPIDAPSFPNPVGLNPDLPSFILSAGSGFNPSGGGTPTEFFDPGLPHPSSPPGAQSSNVFIWNGLGDWDKNPHDWNQGFVPTSAIDTVIIQSGKASYNNGYTVGSLTVSQGATLNITGGSLAATSITNSGLIQLNSSGADPSLAIDGPTTLSGGGVIQMLGQTAMNFIVGAAGTGATLTNADNVIAGSGNIGNGDGDLTFVNDATVDATPILHGDTGLLVVNTGHTVSNHGVFEATHAGELLIEDRLINANLVKADGAMSSIVIKNNSPDVIVNAGMFEATAGGTLDIASKLDNSGHVVARTGSQVLITADVSNESGGSIVADGIFARVDITGTAGDPITVDNAGVIAARHGGTIAFDSLLVANDRHGAIDADGFGATIKFERDIVGNWSAISATLGGLLVVDQSCVTNARGATIEADGRGSEVRFDRDDVDNSGRVEAEGRGTVVLDRSDVENHRHGVIEADGHGSVVRFDHDHVDNFGRIEAEQHGEVTFDRSHIDNDGMIGALRGGAVDFDHTHVDNTDGLIAAIGRDSTIDLDHAHIAGGELATAWGGLIHTVGGDSDLDDVTIACNGDVLVEKGTTLTLDHGTTMNGGLLTVDGTLHIEPSLAVLNGVDVVNHGNIVVGPGCATLEVENGAVITGGHLTVRPSGTLDVDGSTLTDVAISDAGVVNFGAGDTLSPSDVLTFVGAGTVNVQDSANFDVTLAGLTSGDVIDLRDLVVTSAVWNGSSLLLNGAPAAFTISGGLPAGDTFGFTSDGAGGTDLEVLPQLVIVSATAASGTVGSPIALGLSDTVSGDATVTSFVISDIPIGATLSDGHGNSFTATGQLNSVDIHAWATASLTITSPNVDDFALVATVAAADSNGFSYSATTTEAVTVGLEIASSSNQTVTFGGTAGELKLDDPMDFSGHIVGFSTPAWNSDVIDLVGIDFGAPNFAASFSSGVLTVTDGTHSANLALDYFDNLLNFASDGQGGTLVTNQPSTIATGGLLEISKFTIGTVNFGGATGSLTLDNPALFSGHIQNFASNDSIDIAGINFAAPGFAETYNDTTGQLSLTMARTVRASPSTTSTTC
jgi:FecR protein